VDHALSPDGMFTGKEASSQALAEPRTACGYVLVLVIFLSKRLGCHLLKVNSEWGEGRPLGLLGSTYRQFTPAAEQHQRYDGSTIIETESRICIEPIAARHAPKERANHNLSIRRKSLSSIVCSEGSHWSPLSTAFPDILTKPRTAESTKTNQPQRQNPADDMASLTPHPVLSAYLPFQ
jgi:hypothetical protein